MIKSDKWLRKYGPTIFSPFEPEQIKYFDDVRNVISYGVSSYGYDVRLAPTFRVFSNVFNTIIDPKKFDERAFVQIDDDICIIPPNSFCLGRTVEFVHIPRETLCLCIGKSTYARCGIIVNVTPLEPEWRGYVTIEISNTAPLPAKVYANEGIMQLLFLGGDQFCSESYADRKGKYQDQMEISGPKM